MSFYIILCLISPLFEWQVYIAGHPACSALLAGTRPSSPWAATWTPHLHHHQKHFPRASPVDWLPRRPHRALVCEAWLLALRPLKHFPRAHQHERIPCVLKCISHHANSLPVSPSVRILDPAAVHFHKDSPKQRANEKFTSDHSWIKWNHSKWGASLPVGKQPHRSRL